MSWCVVNNERVVVNGEKSILEVVRHAGIDLPTLCYHPELSVYGACRLCLVEVENWGIVAACHPPGGLCGFITNTNRLRRLQNGSGTPFGKT